MTAWIVSVLAFAFAVVLAAENITFLWVHTYPLSVYPPLLLPTILAYLVVGVKTIGDVTTTEEVSRLPMEGPEHFEVRAPERRAMSTPRRLNFGSRHSRLKETRGARA